MNREELIKIVKEKTNPTIEHITEEYVTITANALYDSFVEQIVDCVLAENCKWTSVDDRLPMQEQSNRSIRVSVALNGRTVTNAIFDDGMFWMDGIIAMSKITHWQLFPSPPKES